MKCIDMNEAIKLTLYDKKEFKLDKSYKYYKDDYTINHFWYKETKSKGWYYYGIGEYVKYIGETFKDLFDYIFGDDDLYIVENDKIYQLPYIRIDFKNNKTYEIVVFKNYKDAKTKYNQLKKKLNLTEI